jgi:hypothetical protein
MATQLPCQCKIPGWELIQKKLAAFSMRLSRQSCEGWGWGWQGVMAAPGSSPGVGPAFHVCPRHKKDVDARDIITFARVFEALCPCMTVKRLERNLEGVPLSMIGEGLPTIDAAPCTLAQMWLLTHHRHWCFQWRSREGWEKFHHGELEFNEAAARRSTMHRVMVARTWLTQAIGLYGYDVAISSRFDTGASLPYSAPT